MQLFQGRVPSRGNSRCGDPEAIVSLVLRGGVSGVSGRRRGPRLSWRDGWHTAGCGVGLLHSCSRASQAPPFSMEGAQVQFSHG